MTTQLATSRLLLSSFLSPILVEGSEKLVSAFSIQRSRLAYISTFSCYIFKDTGSKQSPYRISFKTCCSVVSCRL
jgi:hypothetical protein